MTLYKTLNQLLKLVMHLHIKNKDNTPEFIDILLGLVNNARKAFSIA